MRIEGQPEERENRDMIEPFDRYHDQMQLRRHLHCDSENLIFDGQSYKKTPHCTSNEHASPGRSSEMLRAAEWSLVSLVKSAWRVHRHSRLLSSLSSSSGKREKREGVSPAGCQPLPHTRERGEEREGTMTAREETRSVTTTATHPSRSQYDPTEAAELVYVEEMGRCTTEVQ